MITVITVLFVMTLLASIMALNANVNLDQNLRGRQILTALDAADGGVDRLVFVLGQTPTGQQANWTTYLSSYCTSCGGQSWWPSATGATIGKGTYKAHIDCDDMDCASGDPNKRLLTLIGTFGTQTRTVQATVERQSPAAFNYALFADRGFDLHHHGSSWISPTIITPKIHSNGYIKLDYSSTYRVQQIEAATSLTIGAGGGSTPGGRIPSGGYNWSYWISGSDANNPKRCYPPKKFPPLDYTSATWNFPDSSNNCAASPRYSQNAQVIGDVLANQVTVSTTGDTSQPTSGGSWTPLQTGTCGGQPGITDPVTGACIWQEAGNIDAGSVTLSKTGQTWTGASTGNVVTTHCKSGAAGCSGASTVADCNVCNQGTNDTGGSVAGVVNVHPVTWSPGTIPFPSLNYSSVYLTPTGGAQQQQGGTSCSTSTHNPNTGATCHVFPTTDGKDLLTYIANKNNRTDHYDTSTCQTCMFWLDSGGNDVGDPTKVQSVVLRGTYYITSGSLSLNWSSIRSLFGTASDKKTPTIMIQGALLVPSGSVTLQSSLTVVGPTMDPFNPTGTYASTTVPGILAAGSNITANDYDTDSSWNASSLYESLKRNAITVRGLVYSASWNATTNSSVATDQHWHSYDPKNQTTIIGAQAGGKLHDCNSFQFSYDPLVANLPGFTVGGNPNNNTVGVFVVDWKQL